MGNDKRETPLWDGNLMLIDPHAYLPGDKDFYFLTCAWCGQDDSWSYKSTSPEMWVVTEECVLADGSYRYPLPAWVCDDCKAFLQKYAKNFASYGSYGEYLKSPQWERVKWKVMIKAAHRCQLCAGREMLDVHHNTYENIGREKPEDLIVLCRSCHAKHHNKRTR